MSGKSPEAGKQSLKLSTTATKVTSFKVNGIHSGRHITYIKGGKSWVSDWESNLSFTDIQGNVLDTLTTGGGDGYHGVTDCGELLYADEIKKCVRKITLGFKVRTLFKTGTWVPISLHPCLLSGHLLVGLRKNNRGKVIKYDEEGNEILAIEEYNEDVNDCMYSTPWYLAENINGDICTSDYYKKAVIVVDKCGRHRFNYTGHPTGQELQPWGMCTDILGHILVCDSSSLHIVDINGKFLTFLSTQAPGIGTPTGVAVDDVHQLWVGQYWNNTITVYKYLQDVNE